MAPRKSHHDTRSLSTARLANSRRKLLKSALLGGGAVAAFQTAPERWTRPVIEAVSLPAHAQTSLELGEGPWAGGSPQDGAMNAPFRNRNLAGRFVDFLFTPARAGNDGMPQCEATFQICIERTGSGNEIRVRSGFDGNQNDNRVLTPDNNLQFDFSIGDFMIYGAYDATNDQWTGNVSGPCELKDTRAPSGIFTGERVQVASADGRLHLAGVGSNGGQLDAPWTASPGPCFFDER